MRVNPLLYKQKSIREKMSASLLHYLLIEHAEVFLPTSQLAFYPDELSSIFFGMADNAVDLEKTRSIRILHDVLHPQQSGRYIPAHAIKARC